MKLILLSSGNRTRTFSLRNQPLMWLMLATPTRPVFLPAVFGSGGHMTQADPIRTDPETFQAATGLYSYWTWSYAHDSLEKWSPHENWACWKWSNTEMETGCFLTTYLSKWIQPASWVLIEWRVICPRASGLVHGPMPINNEVFTHSWWNEKNQV